MSDDDYRIFQDALTINPHLGDLIQGGGGLRKVRWSIAGRGKSSGVRILYYYYIKAESIYLLYIYKKTEQEDLTDKQLKLLRIYIKDQIK